MSSIFISYAAEDRERAKVVAHALEQHGWSVWWDRKIPLGKSFDEVIEKALAGADCVLVLWTEASAASRWVRAEASEAAAREVLIPVLLEPEVKIPLEFKLLQAANLSDWHEESEHPEFQALLAHIKSMLAAPRTGKLQPAGSAAGIASRLIGRRDTKQRRVRRFAAGFVLIPGALVCIAAAVLMSWRIPTRIQLDAVVDRVSFTLAGNGPVGIPDRPLNFVSLSVENFDEVAFTPDALAAGGTGRLRPVSSTASAGRNQVVLSGVAGYRPVLTIARVEPSAAVAGRLQAIAAQPQSHITVEVSSETPRGLTLRVDGQPLATNVLPVAPLELTANNATVSGLRGLPADDGPIKLAVTLPADNPYLEMAGARRSFALGATLEPSGNVSLVARAAIHDLELLKQGSTGAVESALIGAGEITYVGHPGKAKVALASGDFVGFGALNDAWLTRLELRPGAPGMALQLEGVAAGLETSSGSVKQDRRLSMFDRLWYSAREVALLALAAWVLAIVFGAYKLLRERLKP